MTDALWRVNTPSFIGHSLIPEGATNIVYNPPKGGEVADNLSPMNEAAQDIVDAQKSPHPDKTPEEVETPTPKAKRAAPKADAKPAEGEGDIA